MVEPTRDDGFCIDIEAVAYELERKVSGNLSMPSKCSIFKIPTILSRHSPNSYSPNQFSFGPFHHHNAALKHTEKIKSKYLLDLVNRLLEPSNQATINLIPRIASEVLRRLTIAVADVCKEAWEYYSGPIDMTEHEFTEVLLLDGCFIVELFRKYSYESLRDSDDMIFSTSIMLQFLWHDLILLENQVPWIVLERLFNLTVMQIDKKPLVRLAIEFFGSSFSINPPQSEPYVSGLQGSKHILDLLRNSLVLSSDIKRHYHMAFEPVPSVTILEESGIKIMRGNSRSILDVRFNHKEGVLEIPPLLIHEATETVFRNLISLEQLCPNYNSIFTSYALLLGNLINTTKDIEILCKNRVILNWLDIQSAEFFNKLSIGNFFKEMYYLQLSDHVNSYCRRRLPRYRMVLIRYYFNNPWALISLSVAAFLVLCSFFQTLYTINNHPWAHIFLIVAAVLVACAFLKTLFTIGK